MSNIITRKFRVPGDSDGFVTFQCPYCKDRFKLTISFIEQEETIELFCPYCGLQHELIDFSRDEVIEQAQIIAKKTTINELQKISLEFCKIASRLKETTEYEGMANLKRFLNFIDSTPLLYEFIQKNISKSSYNPLNFDISTVPRMSRGNWSVGYKIPDDNPENEISFIYLLLKSALEKWGDSNDYLKLTGVYQGDTYQGRCDNFSRSVIDPFVKHIENYLSKLQIDLEEEEEKARIVVYNNGNDFTMNQGNTYQQSGTFGIGNISGGTITGTAKIAGVINEDQSKNLTEVAAAIQDLLDYFEQNKPTEIEAERIVESAIERCSELNNAEIVEAAIKTTPNLQKRLKSASYALFIGTIKALRPSVGNVIETVVKAWQNPD